MQRRLLAQGAARLLVSAWLSLTLAQAQVQAQFQAPPLGSIAVQPPTPVNASTAQPQPAANPLQRLLKPHHALASAGTPGANMSDIAPDPAQFTESPTRERQLPLYRAVMAQPLQAPYRAALLAQAYRQAISSPHELMALTGTVAGLSVSRGPVQALQPLEQALRAAADPLAAGLAWIKTAPSPSALPWQPVLPDEASLPQPLRLEVALMLAGMGQAHQFLQRALARLPASVTPALLMRQALDGNITLFEEPDFRQLLPLVEREALLAGMLDLIAATDRLRRFVTTAKPLPAVSWALDTPMGQIVIDTTGRDNQHRLHDPLLVLDVGGNDHYVFEAARPTHRVAVLLDHLGNDHYDALSAGADPSGAVLGYGILWDTAGDDTYQGSQLAQASALFGAALLVDGGGLNHFSASRHAQAHALGGFAVLLSGEGNDRFTAQTQAQASAGPDGVAVLIDPGGNDRYSLDNSPLIRPSPQLPTHNTSMGQGAGRGMRADAFDGRSTAGGIGLLLDLAGDDHYSAQVFAQGAGYQEGLGMLVDDDGNDRFEAAWYAMGSAAHKGAGLLLKRGRGNDVYHASHSMALGAAHDFSVGVFVDEGGDDSYHLGDLGLGAAHDNSVALFIDAAGNDRYTVAAPHCRALGTTAMSEWGTVRENLPNTGLFMDLGGDDRYPAHCAQAGNMAQWTALRPLHLSTLLPPLPLRSEGGAGIDGEFALPLAIHPLTRAPTSAPPR